jgi:predicted lysophospholipase L1 biosynthesis ABC-type transport system permease subunit
VAVVSESFAEQHWPGEPALGQRFEFAFLEREIVGVVGDISVRGPEQPSEPQVYLPAGQVPDGSLTFYTPKDMVVRSSLQTDVLQRAIRDVIRRADPDQPVSNVQTLSAVVDAQTAARAVQLRVISVFAIIALVLAGIGIHGVLAFVVSQRRREIGVRMALGASRGDVIGMVARRTTRLLLVGLVPGVFVAIIAARGLGATLVGVEPFDPLTFAGAVGLCVAAAIVGCLVPVRRAVTVDPATAIRFE